MEQNHFYILLLFLSKTCSPALSKDLSVETNVLRIQRCFFVSFCNNGRWKVQYYLQIMWRCWNRGTELAVSRFTFKSIVTVVSILLVSYHPLLIVFEPKSARSSCTWGYTCRSLLLLKNSWCTDYPCSHVLNHCYLIAFVRITLCSY